MTDDKKWTIDTKDQKFSLRTKQDGSPPHDILTITRKSTGIDSLSFGHQGPPTLTFIGGAPDWVVRILPDGHVELNDAIPQDEAVKGFIEAVNNVRGIPAFESPNKDQAK